MKPVAKIVITGATGFIGRNLARKLAERNYEVHAWVRPQTQKSEILQALNSFALVREISLADEKALAQAFEKIRPDFVIHLASLTLPSRNPADFFPHIENTLEPALHLAQAIPSSVKLSLFVGTCEEYGSGDVPFLETQTPRVLSPYGWAKITAKSAVEWIAKTRKIPVCWVRPFLTFGPGQSSKQLVPVLVDACHSGKRVALTPGMQTRDFIFIDDVCQHFVRILENHEKAIAGTFNFCSGVPRSVHEVGELVQKIAGKGDLGWGDLPYREGEVMSFYGSRENFLKTFGELLLTDFESSIRKTVEFSNRMDSQTR